MASSPLAPSAVELAWPSAAAPITVGVLLEGDEDKRRRSGRSDGRPARGARDGRTVAGPAETGRPAGSATRAPRPTTTQPTCLQSAFWAGQLTSVLTAIRTAAACRGSGSGYRRVGGGRRAGRQVAGDERCGGGCRFVAGLRGSLGGLAGRGAAGGGQRGGGARACRQSGMRWTCGGRCRRWGSCARSRSSSMPSTGWRPAGSLEGSDGGGDERCWIRTGNCAVWRATACTAGSACRPARRISCGARRWTLRAGAST